MLSWQAFVTELIRNWEFSDGRSHERQGKYALCFVLSRSHWWNNLGHILSHSLFKMAAKRYFSGLSETSWSGLDLQCEVWRSVTWTWGKHDVPEKLFYSWYLCMWYNMKLPVSLIKCFLSECAGGSVALLETFIFFLIFSINYYKHPFICHLEIHYSQVP